MANCMGFKAEGRVGPHICPYIGRNTTKVVSLCRVTKGQKTWEELTINFIHTFSFVNDSPFIHSALQDIRDKVLEIVLDILLTELEWTMTPHMMMTCYNVSGEPDDKDDPRVVDIL